GGRGGGREEAQERGVGAGAQQAGAPRDDGRVGGAAQGGERGGRDELVAARRRDGARLRRDEQELVGGGRARVALGEDAVRAREDLERPGRVERLEAGVDEQRDAPGRGGRRAGGGGAAGHGPRIGRRRAVCNAKDPSDPAIRRRAPGGRA